MWSVIDSLTGFLPLSIFLSSQRRMSDFSSPQDNILGFFAPLSLIFSGGFYCVSSSLFLLFFLSFFKKRNTSALALIYDAACVSPAHKERGGLPR